MTTVVNNAAAYMPSQNWALAYANQASCLSDCDDLASSSIFGGGYGLGGRLPFMGMGGYGYGPGSEIMNMSMDDYYKYQSDLNGKQLDYQLAAKRKAQLTGFKSTIAEDVITRRIAALQRAVEDNQQDYVMKEYTKLKNAVKHKLVEEGYPENELNTQQVKAYTDALYAKATGSSIVDQLEEHGDSPFVHGLKQGTLFGLGGEFANQKNYKDNLAKITGEDVTKEDKTWKTVGQWTSAIVTGGLAIIALPWLVRGGFKGAAGTGKSFIGGWKKLFGIGAKTATKP